MWCSLVITWGFHPHNPSSNLGMDIPGLVAQSVERLVSSEQTGDRRSPGPISRGGWFRRPFSMGPEGVRSTSAAGNCQRCPNGRGLHSGWSATAKRVRLPSLITLRVGTVDVMPIRNRLPLSGCRFDSCCSRTPSLVVQWLKHIVLTQRR